MGGLKRRLANLERRSGGGSEQVISREALRRLTGEELERLEAALVRAEAGEGPTEENRAALTRVEAVREEVRQQATRNKTTKGATP